MRTFWTTCTGWAAIRGTRKLTKGPCTAGPHGIKTRPPLALRNSSDQEKSLTGTLRSILDIPANVKGSITFKDSYDDQRTLDGFSGSSVDIDKEISFTLKPFEVLVYEGGKVK